MNRLTQYKSAHEWQMALHLFFQLSHHKLYLDESCFLYESTVRFFFSLTKPNLLLNIYFESRPRTVHTTVSLMDATS